MRSLSGSAATSSTATASKLDSAEGRSRSSGDEWKPAVIGWLYDLMADRAERRGIGERGACCWPASRATCSRSGPGRARACPTTNTPPALSRWSRTRAWPSGCPRGRRSQGSRRDRRAGAESAAVPRWDLRRGGLGLRPLLGRGPPRFSPRFGRCSSRTGSSSCSSTSAVRAAPRWQRRLTPLHRKLAGNCHLDRDTKTTVGAAGFDITGLEPTHLPGTHALVRPGIQGVAIKTSS